MNCVVKLMTSNVCGGKDVSKTAYILVLICSALLGASINS